MNRIFMLTFDKSVFLIVVGNHATKADKTVSGSEVIDAPDDVYFFNPSVK